MVFFAAATFLIYPRLLTTLSSLKTPNLEIKRIIDKAFSISETILVFVFLFLIALAPFFMNLILKKYDDFFYIFTLILFGLIIKSITFFSVSFIVSRKKQKKLLLNSFTFLFIIILLYGFLYNKNIIQNAEEFTLTATIIFLLFSIRLYQWSMNDLKQKNIFNLVVNKFWKLIIIYFLIFICYSLDINKFNALIYIISLTFLYFRIFINNSKIIYALILNLFFKKKLN